MWETILLVASIDVYIVILLGSHNAMGVVGFYLIIPPHVLCNVSG